MDDGQQNNNDKLFDTFKEKDDEINNLKKNTEKS